MHKEYTNNSKEGNENFSWIETAKKIFKITYIINSKKSLMQNIMEKINEISIMLNDSLEYLNELDNTIE